MTYRIRTVSLAIGLALVGALLVTLYVTNYKKHVQQGEQSVQVYVAAHDIAVGTPGKDLAVGKLLVTHDVARRSVVPGPGDARHRRAMDRRARPAGGGRIIPCNSMSQCSGCE